METIVPVRRRPCGQNCEGPPARPTQPAANPDPVVPLIVSLFAPHAVTDDRLIAAYRTLSRQQMQRDRGHPGSVLSSASGSAIKRIKAGVKARPFSTPCQGSIRVAGLHPPVKSDSNEKRLSFPDCYRTARFKRSNCNIGRYRGKFWNTTATACYVFEPAGFSTASRRP
jgi:hypothetical protein